MNTATLMRSTQVPNARSVQVSRASSTDACLKPSAVVCPAQKLSSRGLSGQRLSCSKVTLHSKSRESLVVFAARKIKSIRNVVKTATLVSGEDNVDKVKDLCIELVEAAQLKMEDPSSGILDFSVSEDAYDKGTFHFWERYSDHLKMGTFNSSKVVAGFMEKVRPLLEGPLAMAMYEWRNGQLGPATTPVGPHGEGGLEDAPGGNKGSGGGARLQQTSKMIPTDMLVKMKMEEDGRLEEAV